jgi:hypothetical protein
MPLTQKDQLQNFAILLHAHFWSKLFISRFPELCTTYAGLLLGVIGATQLRKTSSRILFGGWFLSTCVYTILLGDYGYIHQYTSLPFTPIVAVLIAAGLMHLWQLGAGRPVARVVLALFVSAIPVHSFFRIAHWYKPDNAWVFRAHDALIAISAPDDLILVNTNEPPVFIYYLDRYGYTVDLETAEAVDPDKMQAARFFVTPLRGRWSRDSKWPDYFSRNGQRVHQDPEFEIFKLNSAAPIAHHT